MSIFSYSDPFLHPELLKWMKDINLNNNKGKFILLNFFLEERISDNICNLFCSKLSNNKTKNPIQKYREIISKENLFLRISPDNDKFFKKQAIHLASRTYLVESGHVEIALDEEPPDVITIKKPLHEGKIFFWITMDDEIDLTTMNANDIRNVVGLPISKNEYLYYFKFELEYTYWIPSVFDANAMPPFKPLNNLNRGITRNLEDDSIGVTELIIKPLKTIPDCPKGYIVQGQIDKDMPTGYLSKRSNEYDTNPEKLRWGL